MSSLCRLLAVSVLLLLSLAPAALRAEPYGAVIVNGVALDRATVAGLEAAYRTRVLPGRYWYDSHSGLWGDEAGPSKGQLRPGMRLGGPLSPRASVGYMAGVTGVFVNGRELHPVELGYLQRLYGPVQRTRYWLDARGVGGYEGGPAQFDLRARAIAQQGGPGYNRRGQFGNTGSDGKCSYYNDPSSGASVMVGRC